MKNTLLIIISILLSSYLLVSCQKEDDVLYQGGTGNKSFEWKTFGDDNTQPKYRGEISDGKPNGLGTLTLPNGEIMWENGRVENEMVKEHTFHLKEKSMKENGKMKKTRSRTRNLS